MKLHYTLVVLFGFAASASAGPILNITILPGLNLSQPFNLTLNPLASLLPHLNLTLFPRLNASTLGTVQPLNLSLLNLGSLPRFNITLLPGLNLTALRPLNITAGSLVSPLSLLPLFNISAVPRLNFTGIQPAQLNLTLLPLLPRLNLTTFPLNISTFPRFNLFNTANTGILNTSFLNTPLLRFGRSVKDGSSEEVADEMVSFKPEAYTALVDSASGTATLISESTLAAITQAEQENLSAETETSNDPDPVDIPEGVEFVSTNRPIPKDDKPTDETLLPPGTNTGRRPSSGRPGNRG